MGPSSSVRDRRRLGRTLRRLERHRSAFHSRDVRKSHLDRAVRRRSKRRRFVSLSKGPRLDRSPLRARDRARRHRRSRVLGRFRRASHRTLSNRRRRSTNDRTQKGQVAERSHNRSRDATTLLDRFGAQAHRIHLLERNGTHATLRRHRSASRALRHHRSSHFHLLDGHQSPRRLSRDERGGRETNARRRHGTAQSLSDRNVRVGASTVAVHSSGSVSEIEWELQSLLLFYTARSRVRMSYGNSNGKRRRHLRFR